MEYSTPEKRELYLREIELLNHLFSKEQPEWVDLIPTLKVIARCGCGECPTILFGKSVNSNIQTGSLMIDYVGRDPDGNLIGISVFGVDQMPTQLEFYSVDGLANTIDIPELSTLEKVNSN